MRRDATTPHTDRVAPPRHGEFAIGELELAAKKARLAQMARHRPTAVLGALEFWLGSPDDSVHHVGKV